MRPIVVPAARASGDINTLANAGDQAKPPKGLVIDDDFGVASMHHRGTDFSIVSRMQKVAKIAFLFEVTPDTIHGFTRSVRSIA
jgi:hypothetical protein